MFKPLTDLFIYQEFEVLWTFIRPMRLPRGFPCIIVGTMYHSHYPESASDKAVLDYLATSLTTIEGRYPGCGILLTGDFNRLNISRLLHRFKLKQLVSTPTRGHQILDLIITNMPNLYDKAQTKNGAYHHLSRCYSKRHLFKSKTRTWTVS